MQEVVEFFRSRVNGRMLRRLERKLPVRTLFDTPLATFGEVARGKLFDAFDESMRARHVVEGSEVMETERIDLALDFGVDKQRLEFGAKVKVIAAVTKV